MKKILTVIGARPQFIKASVLSRIFRSSANFSESIVHTGQHFDPNMSDVFFREMNIPHPKYSLDIHGLSHGAMTGRMMEGIEKVIEGDRPDIVLVYGDTNSTLAGALVAAKLHIPVAHVEAGLRSWNMKMPEEVNRILTDRMSSLLFCPTSSASNNLRKEGITNGIHVVGDIMADALFHYAENSSPDEETKNLIAKNPGFCLATLHRAENTDDHERLDSILTALKTIAESRAVILPLHPRTRKVVESSGISTSKICLIPPASYFNMIALLKSCSALLTDSGGAQKEAYLFQKPCVILRDETEWVELVESGTHRLAGASTKTILSSLRDLEIAKLDFSKAHYGRGDAGEKIIAAITRF